MKKCICGIESSYYVCRDPQHQNDFIYLCDRCFISFREKCVTNSVDYAHYNNDFWTLVRFHSPINISYFSSFYGM